MIEDGKRSWYRRISDPLIGPEATAAERALGWGAAFAASVAQFAWALHAGRWSLPQTFVAAIVAFDIGGGVVVNATRSGRRWWHRAELSRIRKIGFFAVHLHPFIVAWLWPEFSWAQAAGLYASTLVFAIAVAAWTPGYLKRPLAFGLSAIGIVLGATILRAPAGLAWLPTLYCLKLVAAHAVPDA